MLDSVLRSASVLALGWGWVQPLAWAPQLVMGLAEPSEWVLELDSDWESPLA